MRPQDWFGVGVRLLGAWCLVRALDYLLYFSQFKLGFVEESTSSVFSNDPPSNGLLVFVGYLALGLYFLLGTGHLIRNSYKEETPEEEPEPEPPPAELAPPPPPPAP